MEPVRGEVVLSGLDKAKEVVATALDGAGKSLGECQAGEKTPRGWKLRLAAIPTTWYLIRVSR